MDDHIIYTCYMKDYYIHDLMEYLNTGTICSEKDGLGSEDAHSGFEVDEEDDEEEAAKLCSEIELRI